ncbi:MAG: hypothetical protein FJ028_06750 [Chloroflexi bacterium]|nr:hypothetical protein [Chloroflexota bacterium]
MNSPAMMSVTDPDRRTAGQTASGAVDRIPGTAVTGPQDHPRIVEVSAPRAGERGIAVQPKGGGGPL